MDYITFIPLICKTLIEKAGKVRQGESARKILEYMETQGNQLPVVTNRITQSLMLVLGGTSLAERLGGDDAIVFIAFYINGG